MVADTGCGEERLRHCGSAVAECHEPPALLGQSSDSVHHVTVHTEPAEALDDVEDSALERFLGNVPG